MASEFGGEVVWTESQGWGMKEKEEEEEEVLGRMTNRGCKICEMREI
jgi:hypothetical protein